MWLPAYMLLVLALTAGGTDEVNGRSHVVGHLDLVRRDDPGSRVVFLRLLGEEGRVLHDTGAVRREGGAVHLDLPPLGQEVLEGSEALRGGEDGRDERVVTGTKEPGVGGAIGGEARRPIGLPAHGGVSLEASGRSCDIACLICSYSWPCDTALRVGYCESRFVAGAIDPTGTYFGTFQLSRAWATEFGVPVESFLDAGSNVYYAHRIWSEYGGWQHWRACL